MTVTREDIIRAMSKVDSVPPELVESTLARDPQAETLIDYMLACFQVLENERVSH